jgi:hypothetical protein
MGMGVNDTTIFAGIVIFFIFLGVIAPFINQEFRVYDYNTKRYVNPSMGSGMQSDIIKDDVANCSLSASETLWNFFTFNLASVSGVMGCPTNFFSLFFSVIRMFIWYGAFMPLWIEMLLLMPMRIILIVIGVRWIRGQGG